MLEFFRTITSRRNEDGASAVEYGLLVAGIAALIVAVVFVFGGVIKDSFKGTCNRMARASATAASTTCDCTVAELGPTFHRSAPGPASPHLLINTNHLRDHERRAVGGSSAGVTEHRAPTTGGW